MKVGDSRVGMAPGTGLGIWRAIACKFLSQGCAVLAVDKHAGTLERFLAEHTAAGRRLAGVLTEVAPEHRHDAAALEQEYFGAA